MSNRKLAIAIGGGIAVLLGVVLGLVFGAGGTKAPKSATPVVAAAREPDSGLQVVVGPSKAVSNAPKLTPVASTAPLSSAHAGAAPAAGTQPAKAPPAPATVGPMLADSRPAPELRVAPRPMAIPPVSREDDEEAAPPPLRRAPPLRPAAPRRPEPDQEDDGPPAPPPPPPAD